MRKGAVSLESPLGSLDAVLSPILNVGGVMFPYFRATADAEPICVNISSVLTEAFRCGRCTTVVLVGTENPDIECLSCGATISGGVSTCTKCGWSYEAGPEGNSKG
jgi:hypothetical protein